MAEWQRAAQCPVFILMWECDDAVYLVNYKEYSEFVGDMMVRPGIAKIAKAKAKEIEKGALPPGVVLCESLDDIQWESFPLGVKQVYAQDERYRAYLGAGEDIDQYSELRRALESMNRAAAAGPQDGSGGGQGDDAGEGE